ncbi:hypothetical protein BDZ94DRAFT_1262769 [Collybia nuda]|uniref:G domain-containing protein n=1 Tax=Collybia nuda TaxID=64659 RepID=A0A9P5Y574_9AGAR|nr:hypothetical protein BDZ94DRAFT_1262769 [Collybia nuda]
MSNPQLNVQRSNTAPTPNTKEMKRYTKLKKKAKRFRVLIIGGANAGKTTILRKICNTTDNPEIFDGEGRKININLEPTILRGDHDVENEMVFRKNSTFIFHDSRGFEAGGVEEFEKVKAFISDHARKKKMKDQVHVIWYCVALDDDRPVTYAERQFFSELGTGKVPVIVIFTKCEALELKAIGVLEDEGCDFVDAVEKASVYVREKLKNIHETFEAMRYPPKGHVYLQELEKKNSNCQELVECTIQVLDSKILQGLFISTQQNSLELAVRYSMRNVLEGVLSFMEVITPTIKKTSEKERRKPPSEVETGREGRKSLNEWRIEMFKNVFKYFPYHYVSTCF